DPGRQPGAQVERTRLAPYDQHRVVQDFIDQLRPSGLLLDKSPEPGIVPAEERLESGHVAACNLADQCNLLSRVRRSVSSSCIGFGAFATRHSYPPLPMSGKAAVGVPARRQRLDRSQCKPSPLRRYSVPGLPSVGPASPGRVAATAIEPLIAFRGFTAREIAAPSMRVSRLAGAMLPGCTVSSH